MMVKCTLIADGPGPSEVTVSILTVEGHREEVVLAKRFLKDNKMNVGAALMRDGDKYLIELPRESASGRWRIWVPSITVAHLRRF